MRIISIPDFVLTAGIVIASAGYSPAGAAAAGAAPGEPATAPKYPVAQRADHFDEYHGVKVADPYRWMEDIDSPATRAWVEAQAHLTGEYLAAIPGRKKIAQRLKEIWNYERWSAPERHGAQWFYLHNSGLQDQSLLFATADTEQPARVLLDPNTLSKDGTIAFKGAGYSDDGRLMAYGLSEAGSDWEVWRVRDVATGKDMPDEIRWAKFTSAWWRKDGSGFYYCGYSAVPTGQSLKAPSQYHKVFFHKLGTPQSQDPEIYGRTDNPDWYLGGQVTDDGRYLVITANHGTDVKNTLLVADLTTAGAAVMPVIAEPRASYTFVGNIDSTLYVLTDDAAPRSRLIAIDLAKPDSSHWSTIVAETQDTLDTVTLVGHQFIARYLHDAHSVVRRYAADGKSLGEVQLPGLGTTSGFAGRIEDSLTYYS
jgi:prolyl oligopeptidase